MSHLHFYTNLGSRSNGDPESASEIEGRLVMIWKG